MKGNFHVRFLGGKGVARHLTYPTLYGACRNFFVDRQTIDEQFRETLRFSLGRQKYGVFI